jgi:hypothetical protein
MIKPFSIFNCAIIHFKIKLLSAMADKCQLLSLRRINQSIFIAKLYDIVYKDIVGIYLANNGQVGSALMPSKFN